ncbi:outer membrane protein assembly factor [Dyadobacter sp. CY312]|uniref:outer membrane protein assembly factor n=1 Tax=Dyadobacter sp. CY312 TaxID=2907303 RepID=UPI001F378AF8|nr:outer membrane protein assembly factor [Dyadobacter sp. CY312]MCE7041637.1 outer membrane protein assembly factor [Dyadobacter sp. CY312]
MKIKFLFLLAVPVNLIAILGLNTDASAQRYPSQETFGKNRVQYKTFNWKIFKTTNFEIYHYQGGADLAKLTAQYAESEFDKITDVLGWTPYNRVKIFLYNSPAELEQSNMGLSTMDNRDDEKLDLAQSRVEIAYTGDQIGFRKKLVNDVSLLFVYDMLYGGNMKEALQSSLLLTLPEWFMSGTAAYISEGWSPELNDYMRDFFKNRNVRKPTLLSGNDAKLIGHSIWNYIAERYGKDKISDILNLTRIIRTEQTSITSTLGVPSYNRFLRDWRAYYLDQNKNAEQHYTEAQPSWKIKLNEYNGAEAGAVVKISQDKKFTAVSEIKNSRYRVYVVDSETGSKKVIRQGKSDQIGSKMSSQPPLLGWAKNNTLFIMASESGRKNLYVYENIGTKKVKVKLRKNIRGLDQIVDMDVSHDGTMLAVSGDRAGRNDIYLISVARASALPLTSDLFDDFSPRFIQGSSRKLVFASNRPVDSLGTTKGDYKTINSPISLFEHDGTPKTGEVKLLLKGDGKTKVAPIYADANEVFYLSDGKGVSNVFKLTRASEGSTQLTNYIHSIKSADVHVKSGGALAYTYLYDGHNTVALKNGFDTNAALNTPALGSIDAPAAGTPDATAAIPDTNAAKQTVAPALVLKEGEVDTDNYQFDEDVLKGFESRQRRGALSGTAGVLSRTKPTRENISIKGPYPYKGLFITNDATSDWRVDPIRGFGYAQSLSMNDLLENHVIKAGFFISSNFRNSDLFAEYNNNTYRIDFGLRIDRRALYANVENYPQKYRYNQVTFSASYPFSNTSRITLSPMFSSTRLIDMVILQNPDLTSNYGGLRSEYVFDNTKVNGMNMMEGTRFKIRFDMQAGLTSSNESFNRLSLDFRHYQKIHRDLILAIRASGSHSAGKAPKQNIMGGMENWIGNKKDGRAQNDALAFGPGVDNRDIFFADFATNLRGFNLNRLSGTSYMLLNAELRIPLIKYLYRGSITSSFLRNFQVVGFGDIGTAWTGKGPFSENSSLNTTIIGADGDTYRATVTTYKNPYLSGYGVGARTTLFGFYVKFDYAWGVDNGSTNKAIPYFTLGYDF